MTTLGPQADEGEEQQLSAIEQQLKEIGPQADSVMVDKRLDCISKSSLLYIICIVKNQQQWYFI